MSGPVARRRALLIHTENYQDGRFPSLPSTCADTDQLRQVLEHRKIGAFDSLRVVGDRSADDMRVEISEFLGSCGSDELALLYLSGHGVRLLETTGEFYFVAADTDYDRLAETAVSAGFVNEELEQCWAPHTIAMLDCCLSGGFALGFQTADRGQGAVKSATPSPLNSRGVYVLSSSGPLEESFSGTEAPDGVAPSVFTGAVVETLRTGKASKDGSGNVSVDDLFEHVNRQLRGQHGQIPTKSSLGVNDRIVIASCPTGAAPELAALTRERKREQRHALDTDDMSSRTSKSSASWAELLEYYRACVLDENTEMPYLSVADRGREYVCLRGAECAVSGDLDEHGTMPLSNEVTEFLDNLDDQDELWAGYPAVVLNQPPQGPPWPKPRFAPLLMRRVDTTAEENGAPRRLRPYGPVVPHPVLAKDHLDEEQANYLIDTYQPTWHAGQHSRLATDARHLLQSELEVPCLRELRPDLLEDEIDTNSPGDGARNAAVLIRVSRTGKAHEQLRKDLDYIGDQGKKIGSTAMGSLLSNVQHESTSDTGSVCTPLPANEAQLAVLRATLSQRLTVATGPPGTGKSQLVTNAIATAMANDQSVLMASTNNQAVDEVWQRCQRVLGDSVVRTGSAGGEVNYRECETEALQRLLKTRAPNSTLSKAFAEHTSSVKQRDRVHQDCARKSKLEQDLLEVAQAREECATCLDHTTDELAKCLGQRPKLVESRARRVAETWFFGAWRRRRLLRDIGIDSERDARTVCQHIAQFAALESQWRGLQEQVHALAGDAELADALDTADTAVQQASRVLWETSAAGAVHRGKAAIQSLIQATAGSSKDWSELRAVLSHVRAWATTSLSARRFPTQPGLFDLVIIDEASQCSIPQVLPLLFRARRALIIGDVMQLPHITGISAQREALVRQRAGVSSTFVERHKLSFRRHSAFHLAEMAGGGSFLLDEHYRCHPDIAAVSNELFYGDALTVLTDVRGRPAVDRPAVAWAPVDGSPQLSRTGKSWINRAEARMVDTCVDYLLERLPSTATIGVVTPFKPQREEIAAQWRHEDRVRVGTVHTFQGGECDAVVFSLVAGNSMYRGTISWVNRQLNLWNVAITRARSHLIVVGDKEFWRGHGGTGGALVRAAESDTNAREPGGGPDFLVQRLYELVSGDSNVEVEPAVQHNGYEVDTLLTYDDGTARAVLLDRGNGADSASARHLRLMLRRRSLVAVHRDGPIAVRLPAWTLYDQDVLRTELGLREPDPTLRD